MNSEVLSKSSRLLIVIAALTLIISLFVPLWRIELDAPQYPEGLVMKIYPHQLGGDVEIINGLNHYIGMQTLHTENFIEFIILPYIIGAFAFLLILTVFVNKKKALYFSFVSFVLFGVVSMVDFWRWEYNYGHNLDPNAAIIVPGMAYQPPLIGFKQLLNFGAFSIPDIGGWLFVLCGLLLLLAVSIEKKVWSRFSKKKSQTLAPLLVFFVLVLSSCGSNEPDKINLHKDHCDFCKMSISDGRLGAEIITAKGRVYKFDDMGCLLHYIKENKATINQSYWVNDYTKENILIDAESAYFVPSEEIKSPMGGNIAAFADEVSAKDAAAKYNSDVLRWKEISPGKKHE